MKDLGRGLALARQRAGLSQEAAAEAVGLNRVVLSYYETGRRQPPLGVVVALARLYGIPLPELLDQVEGKAEAPATSEILSGPPLRSWGRVPGSGCGSSPNLSTATSTFWEISAPRRQEGERVPSAA